MVDIYIHGVLKLICPFIPHHFALALVGGLDAVLLAGVETHEFCDKGVVWIEIELIIDPLVCGCWGELLHEYVPMVEIRVYAAIWVA